MSGKEQRTLHMCVVDEYIGSEVPPYLREERQRWTESLAWSCVGLSCITKGISKDEAMHYIEKAEKEMGLVDAATSLKALLNRPYLEACQSITDFIAKVNRDMDGMESEEKFRLLYENVGTIAMRFVLIIIK
ncbi:hypothetical protein [Bacillus cabrialesii]|uniref:hypothetical protein n=1 Tax=Bacillus cabrialesii TaxID=2487276 RepID=UPI0028F7E4AD|nr:hypothetical protein [Bacillus cabrialesii]MDU0153998.1 hypothetical protein [Bacillus cabrialesii]